MNESNKAVPTPAPAAVVAPIALTFEQIKELLEMNRTPVVTDQERRELASMAEDRRANAELVVQQAADKKFQQKTCSHMRRDGSTRAVYIKGGNYIICQLCHDIIRPEARPDDFNKLFQLTASAEIF